MDRPDFKDHFSAVAQTYAQARPEYPAALFDWIAGQAPGRDLAWDAACGSGQASRGLAGHFAAVHASDASAEQLAQAVAPANVRFVVEPAERCSLPDAAVDAVCVAQALHWFAQAEFFAECARVLRPGGLLVAWSYEGIRVPAAIAEEADAFARDIFAWWPPERVLVGAGYADFDWPFAPVQAPVFTLEVDWPLPRLLGYYASYSATRRCRAVSGVDPVARHAPALTRAWGDPARLRRRSWARFLHARRKP